MKRRAAALLGALALGACGGGKVYPVPVEGSPQRGAADAWVTVAEFGDFQCPYCIRAAGTVQELRAAYPEADLRLVFKHLPLSFHERAMPAALAAQCAFEQGAFWEMYDLLYGGTLGLSDADLDAAAAQVGLDVAAWKACLVSKEASAAVDRDVTLAEDLGIGGTPTFFINGQVLVGAQPLEKFKEVVDREMKKAQESGIGRASYYDVAVLGK